MSIVVSDTSPIRAFHFLRQISLLQRLFGAVIIPPAVANELIHPAHPFEPLDLSVIPFVEVRAPGATLRSVQAAADRRPDFFRENVNSTELVKLLRSLAYDAASFDQAVGLIGQFARSKTESNNMGDAINVFKSLFFIVLSGTHASAEQRAVFLRKLAGSGRSEDRQLVLAA